MPSPLVTFVVLGYNQEQYIREAVDGALAQDYSPLEIILSDDCSHDGTYGIMLSMAAEYRGPHKLILNRNDKNLGIGAHVNRAMELSRGGLIVIAAGDDISARTRTTELYTEWERQGRRPTSIYSDYEIIDERGGAIKESGTRTLFIGVREQGLTDLRLFIADKHRASILGATHAWSRSLFQEYGPLNDDIMYEDKSICFRSLISGEFAYVPKCLVSYRMHSSNIWGRYSGNASRVERVRSMIAHRATLVAYGVALLRQHKKDVLAGGEHGVLQSSDVAILCKDIDNKIKIRQYEWQVYARPVFASFIYLMRVFLMLPPMMYSLGMAKHWLFRAADTMRLLPRGFDAYGNRKI